MPAASAYLPSYPRRGASLPSIPGLAPVSVAPIPTAQPPTQRTPRVPDPSLGPISAPAPVPTDGAPAQPADPQPLGDAPPPVYTLPGNPGEDKIGTPPAMGDTKSPENKEKRSMSSGLIAGATVAVAVLLLLCAAVAFFVCARRKKQKQKQADLDTATAPATLEVCSLTHDCGCCSYRR